MTEGKPTSVDLEAVSLSLCHARAVLMLLVEVTTGYQCDAIETALHFVNEAKAMVDQEPEAGTPGQEGAAAQTV